MLHCTEIIFPSSTAGYYYRQGCSELMLMPGGSADISPGYLTEHHSIPAHLETSDETVVDVVIRVSMCLRALGIPVLASENPCTMSFQRRPMPG